MQRPRSKLQVSTFPFLAVLLCAMGALLLLLFIMDRRAKIAAQYTVAEAVAERKKRSEDEEAARKAEWERARALLHQSLLEQQNQVLGDAKGVEQGLTDANEKLAIAQTQKGDLDAKIKAESDHIAVLQLRIASENASLKNNYKMETKSKAELLDAARELAELEQAFRRLKALRERDKQTYSVVPYRGKRGDLRPPIYVECVRDGVIFHPEKTALQRWQFTPDSLRAEVERRTGPLALEMPVKDAGRAILADRKVPYVLFLVRPDGISSYYKSQAGLKGYQLDFGYELVDESWVLDFNADPNEQLPRRNFAKSTDAQTPTFRPSSLNFSTGVAPGRGGIGNGAGPVSGGFGQVGSGTGNGTGSGGFGQVGSGAGNGTGNGGARPAGVGFGPPGTGPNRLGGNLSGGTGGIGTGTGGVGLGPVGVAPYPGTDNPAAPGAPPFGPVISAYRGVDTGIPVRGSTFVPFGRQQQPIAVASSGIGDPSLPFSGGAGPSMRPDLIGPTGIPTGPPGTPGYPANGGAFNGSGTISGNQGGGSAGNYAGATPGNPGSGGPSNGSGATSGNPANGSAGNGSGANGENGAPPIATTPIPGNSVGTTPAGAAPTPGDTAQSGGSTTAQGPAGSPTGQAQEQGSGDGLAGPRMPSFGPAPPRKPAPPASPLSRLLGNKDFVITISCYAEHVTVFPVGLQYRWDKGNAAENDKGLVQTVTNLIARRQASVRPGEPPYRPIIRFEVPADGYPTYYRAYPLLEPLQVPMTKENTRD